MTERKMRIWIGVFVLGSLLLLAWLIILFGSAPHMFKTTTRYFVRFTDAQGIGPGSPVRRSGVRIGEVRDVILDDEKGDVKVELAIDKRFTLRQGDEAMVVTGLLGGDANIDIIPRPRPKEGPPPPPPPPLPPDSEITGIPVPTVNAVLNQASGVVPAAQGTLNDISKSVQRVERAIPVFEEAVREYQELAKDVRKITPSLQQTSEDFQQLVRAARDAVPDARKTLQEVGELSAELRKAVPSLNQTSDEIRNLAQDARTKTLPSLTQTSDEVRELTKELRGVPGDARKTLDEAAATMRTWGKVGERVDVLIQTNQDKLVKSLENLNEALARISGTFSEANQTNLSEFLRNVRAASGNFEGISRNIDNITTEGRTSVRRLNSTLERADSLLKELQGTTDGQQGGRTGRISRNLDESLEKMNGVLSDVRVMVRTIGQADGTLSRLLTDPSVYNKIDETVCNLPRLMMRVEKIVKSFEVFADKLARHPEAIGLGGVVRPGNGINDAASSGANKSYYPPPEQPVAPRK